MKSASRLRGRTPQNTTPPAERPSDAKTPETWNTWKRTTAPIAAER